MKENVECRERPLPPQKIKNVWPHAWQAGNEARECLQNPPYLASLFEYVIDLSQPFILI